MNHRFTSNLPSFSDKFRQYSRVITTVYTLSKSRISYQEVVSSKISWICIKWQSSWKIISLILGTCLNYIDVGIHPRRVHILSAEKLYDHTKAKSCASCYCPSLSRSYSFQLLLNSELSTQIFELMKSQSPRLYILPTLCVLSWKPTMHLTNKWHLVASRLNVLIGIPNYLKNNWVSRVNSRKFQHLPAQHFTPSVYMCFHVQVTSTDRIFDVHYVFNAWAHQ